MKNASLISVICVIVITLLLTACGKQAQLSPQTTTFSPPLQTTTPPTTTAATPVITSTAPTTTSPPTTITKQPELKPAAFTISNLTVTPSEVISGAAVTIEVIATNTGELSGSFDVNLKIDGVAEFTQKVTLAGGASQKVSFRSTKTTAKSYTVVVDILTGVFTVKTVSPPPPTTPEAPKPFTLTSTAFEQNAVIPYKYTCDGPDVSPQLNWANPPQGTKAFALICDDPDAPGAIWVHWVIFNIPATATSLQEGIPKQAELADGTLQGRNDFGGIGYGGPCPPSGSTHRYMFTLYALDGPVNLQAGTSKNLLVSAMTGHTLGQVQLVGTFMH